MQKFVMRKTYYDYLLLGPLKMHLSIAVGDLPDGKFPFGLDFIIRFTGLALGEINDTLFKLDYFERKMVFLADSELTSQIIDHYKTQAYTQFYKLILGLDIIGNPMKLALGIKKGIGDFFYEPAVGIVHGPEEFAEGIAIGETRFFFACAGKFLLYFVSGQASSLLLPMCWVELQVL